MGTSGNPAKRAADSKAERVYAHLILSVEIVKPEALDMLGYQHPYWPGEMVMDRHDYGTIPTVVDYPDGPITFRCTIMRLIVGELREEGMKMDPAYQPLMHQLAAGLNADKMLEEAMRQYSDEVKDAIAREHGDEDPVLARIDALRAAATRGVRQH